MHSHHGGVSAWQGRWGFTLIEMLLALAILVIITVTVYQFSSVTMRAADASLKYGEQAMQFGGFRRLLTTQLSSLPAGQTSALIGLNIRGKGGTGRRDALQMVCPAGNALLTPDAKGFYQVTLDLRETPRGSGHYALGMEREPWTDDEDDDDEDEVGVNKPNTKNLRVTNKKLPSDWVMLIEKIQSLEIAYFDARLNGWVDKWVDSSLLPNLVRVRLTPEGGGPPYEVVERVPGGGIVKTALPASVQAILNNGGAGRVANPNGSLPGGPNNNPGGVNRPVNIQQPNLTR